VVYAFEVGRDSDGEVFEVVDITRGPWSGPPRFGIAADWVVAPDGDPAAFVASRRALFALRVAHIPSFHTDYLLSRIDDPGRYTVLGLYGDEQGLELARGHPSIRRWAEANSPAQCGARDVSGVHLFRIAMDRQPTMK